MFTVSLARPLTYGRLLAWSISVQRTASRIPPSQKSPASLPCYAENFFPEPRDPIFPITADALLSRISDIFFVDFSTI
jgi:hypothetical protein